MRKILHFVIDDKFTLDSMKCFDNSGLTQCTYLYYKPKYKNNIEYLNNTCVKVVDYQKVKDILYSEEPYDAIILHSLYALPADIISSIPLRYKVVWFAWGFDLYSNPYPITPLLPIARRYKKETKLLLRKIEIKANIQKYIRHIGKLILKKRYSSNNIYKAINRIDYFAGVFSEEYDFLKSKITCFRAKKLIHNYIHPQEFAKDAIYEPVNLTGTNILLGNSATKIGNHLDLIELMNCRKINVNTIYCPLSYQGTSEYIAAVKSKGENAFGNKFFPMIDFLPFDEYIEIMNSCGSLILGQMQQAATCNILSAIWSGLKVFLPKDSMNYIHYKNEGLTVYSIEDDLTNEAIKTPRATEEIIATRKIIESIYSYRRWIIDLDNFLNILDQN